MDLVDRNFNKRVIKSNYKYQNSTKNKKKFDIVAAVGMCELGDEELQGIVPRQVNIINNEFQDIGFYYDEYGIKRHGIIPKKNNQILPGKIETISYDNYGTRTSNPNLL